MPYVERDGSLAIIALHGAAKPVVAEEYLAEDNAEVMAFRDPSLTLAGAISDKKNAVDALRDLKSSADFTHGANIFDADKTAQQNIGFAVSYGQLSGAADVDAKTWILADNSTASFTWGEFRAMAIAMFERAETLSATARAHKDNIGVLLSVDDVIAYDITANW